MKPNVTGFFDPTTNTISYVVAEPGGPHCAIIDPVLDYDHKSGRTTTANADRIIAHIRDRHLRVDWILETHAHADHLSAAPYLKSQFQAQIAIGEHITQVQEIFAKIFNPGTAFCTDGSQFDRLFTADDCFNIGAMTGQVLHTPGHTPACVSYLIGDTAFVGDTLFMPDYGTARADFPGGDAATMYRSIQQILALPPATRLFLCHDYKAPERDHYAWESTVAAQREHNVHVREGIGEAQFVSQRQQRDATLEMPRLLLPAVQVNIRAGHLPEPEDNGVSYLKIPLNLL